MMGSAGGSQFLGDDGSASGSLFLRPLCSDELWNVHRRESTLLPLSEGRVELADGCSVKLLGPCREGMYPVSMDSTGTGVRVECVPAAQLRLKGEMPVGAAHDVLFSSVEAMPNVKAMRTTADRLLAAMQICPDDWGFKYACWLFYATLLLDPRFEHETEDLVRHPLFTGPIPAPDHLWARRPEALSCVPQVALDVACDRGQILERMSALITRAKLRRITGDPDAQLDLASAKRLGQETDVDRSRLVLAHPLRLGATAWAQPLGCILDGLLKEVGSELEEDATVPTAKICRDLGGVEGTHDQP